MSALASLPGDQHPPWSRRIKIDIHDIEPELLRLAMADGLIIETRIAGTATDGTPVCAAVTPITRQVIAS